VQHRRGAHIAKEPAQSARSSAAAAEPVLRWRCPSCSAVWIDRGDGFPGHRFSACLRCGAHALEASDSGASWAPLPPALNKR
jgi:hypothetical protein